MQTIKTLANVVPSTLKPHHDLINIWWPWWPRSYFWGRPVWHWHVFRMKR